MLQGCFFGVVLQDLLEGRRDTIPLFTMGLQNSGSGRTITCLGQEGRPSDGSPVLVYMLMKKPIEVSYH